MTAWYTGVIPILPTPFHDDQSVDLDSLQRLIAFLREVGVDGVTVLGVLGEAPALTDAEAGDVVRAAVEAAGSIPVVVGASRYGVRATHAMAEVSAREGAAGVMVAPPGIDGMGEAAVHRYFAGVGASAPLPIIVQDHPASTKVHMPTDLLVRLIEEIETVAGLKCEAVPTASKVRAIKARNQRVPVMTGLGALYARFDLAAGSDGFNTGFAFPEVLLQMTRLAAAGRWAEVNTLYARFLPLIVLEQQPGPAVRKEIWRRRGILSSAQVREPAAQLDPFAASALDELLKEAAGGATLDAMLDLSAAP